MAILSLLLAACSGGAPRDTVVIIPPGASIAKAGEILEQAGPTSAAAFVNHARFFGGDAPIKPGESQVTQGMGAGTILDLTQAGKTIQRFCPIHAAMRLLPGWERLWAEEWLR